MSNVKLFKWDYNRNMEFWVILVFKFCVTYMYNATLFIFNFVIL